jgi:hypothetical protein
VKPLAFSHCWHKALLPGRGEVCPLSHQKNSRFGEKFHYFMSFRSYLIILALETESASYCVITTELSCSFIQQTKIFPYAVCLCSAVDAIEPIFINNVFLKINTASFLLEFHFNFSL